MPDPQPRPRRRFDLRDPRSIHRLSLGALLAWVALGSDGLSSVVYGPEEAFLALGDRPALGLLVAGAAAITIWVIAGSYSRVIELFPSGAGGYAVASRLLAPHVGMVSGCALLIDYVLTVTISMAAGVEAVLSFLGPEWQERKLMIAVAGTILLMLANLRGVRETVLPLVPVFLAFLATHIVGIVLVFVQDTSGIGELDTRLASDWSSATTSLGTWGALLLVAHAFSTGAGTFTGIEAVSNGLPVLREPRIPTARRTLFMVAASLSLLAVGLMVAYIIAGVGTEEGKTLNAVLWEHSSEGWPSPWGSTFVFVTLLSEALLLVVAAQTGFVDGPRVLASMAADRFWPAKFSVLTDRLVASRGVVILGLAAVAAMLVTGASVKSLVVLYSISVFVTFVLTHLAVVRHMIVPVRGVPIPKRRTLTLAMTLLGLALTSLILFLVIYTKAAEGGWLTLAALAVLCGVSLFIRSRYQSMRRTLGRIRLESIEGDIQARPHERPLPPRSRGRSAVLLVGGYNVQGLALLQNVARDFADDVEELVFVEAGLLDAGTFKGGDSAGLLTKKVEEDTARYVQLAESLGFRARAVHGVGTDLGDEVERLVRQLQSERTWIMVFVAEVELPGPTRFDRWLRANITRVLRRRLQKAGVPMRVVTVRPRAAP